MSKINKLDTPTYLVTYILDYIKTNNLWTIEPEKNCSFKIQLYFFFMPQYVFRMMRIPELLRKKVFKPLNPWKNFVNTTIPIMKEVVIEHLKATKDNNVIMFHDLTAFLWREFWEGSTSVILQLWAKLPILSKNTFLSEQFQTFISYQ